MLDFDQLLKSPDLQRKTLTYVAVGGTAVGALGGLLYAMPRSFRSERGAVWHAAKALGGGTAICLASAFVVVQSVKWSMGVTTVHEFASAMRRIIRPISRHFIKERSPLPPTTTTTTSSQKSDGTVADWLLGNDDRDRHSDNGNGETASTKPPPSSP
jgi:hypothetical protein